jgi:hypothetical protein
MITTPALIESLEWLLKRANGSHVQIDIYTLRKVLDALKAGAIVLVLATTVQAGHVRTVRGHVQGQLPGQMLNQSMRSSPRNNDPFGRSGLGDHVTYNLRG